MGNPTCFICRAGYPSGNIAISDPLCVDVAGKLIFDLTVIVYNSTKMLVVGSKKVHVLTRPHMHAYMSAHSHSIVLNCKGLTGKNMLFCTEYIL